MVAVIAYVAFLATAFIVGGSLLYVGLAIKAAENPLIPFLALIAGVVAIAFIGQFIARLPEEGVHPAHEH
jgi:hypothetical protein